MWLNLKKNSNNTDKFIECEAMVGVWALDADFGHNLKGPAKEQEGQAYLDFSHSSTLLSCWLLNSVLIYVFLITWIVPSVLWRCWLGGRNGIRSVKNWVVGFWRGYLSGARCRLAYNPAGATVSCFSEIQINFTFLVPAHPGSPGKGAVSGTGSPGLLNGCVFVCAWPELPFDFVKR